MQPNFVIFLILQMLAVIAALNPRVSRLKTKYPSQQTYGMGRYHLSSYTSTNSDDETSTNYPSSNASVTLTPKSISVLLEPEACSRPYSCLNCSMYRLCVPGKQGYTEIQSGPCPVERPYCDDYSGTCVNHIDAAIRCGSPDQNFHCMHDGYFPHPTDVTKYFICSNLKAYRYSCRAGYKYYALSSGCQFSSWITKPFDCSALNATKVHYTAGGLFFAYCVNSRPYVVSNCLEGEFFNSTSQVCEPHCTKECMVADRNNCMKYFKCLRIPDSISYSKELLQCPDGKGFDNNLKNCVSLNQLPNCKPNNVFSNNTDPF